MSHDNLTPIRIGNDTYYLARPVDRVLSDLDDTVAELRDSLRYMDSIKTENDELQEENRVLESRIREMEFIPHTDNSAVVATLLDRLRLQRIKRAKAMARWLDAERAAYPSYGTPSGKELRLSKRADICREIAKSLKEDL